MELIQHLGDLGQIMEGGRGLGYFFFHATTEGILLSSDWLVIAVVEDREEIFDPGFLRDGLKGKVVPLEMMEDGLYQNGWRYIKLWRTQGGLNSES